MVAALDDHMGGAGGRQLAPIREDRCAGRNQGTAEPPITGQESCRTRLQGGERSMTDDLIDGQWKQIYFLIPLPPSPIKSPWIYSFFPSPSCASLIPSLPFFSLTLSNSSKRAFSLLAFLPFLPRRGLFIHGCWLLTQQPSPSAVEECWHLRRNLMEDSPVIFSFCCVFIQSPF